MTKTQKQVDKEVSEWILNSGSILNFAPEKTPFI
jgi:hypothetical protein